MKKINIKNYDVEVINEAGEKKTVAYDVKSSIVELLFIPALKLNGSALMEQMALAGKIKAVEGDYLLLEEEEYRRVQRSFALFEGFGKREIELVKRVLNAETVTVDLSTQNSSNVV